MKLGIAMTIALIALIAIGGMSLLLVLTTVPWIFAIFGEGWLDVAPASSNPIRSTLSIVIL
ncbi:hypothetical protein [Chamaesiphon sp.]|uniref:hypothetical protein n=1 Tax=Chamaesiphon sp. TaxID=2814140 RepID=UPI003593440C